MDDKFSLRPSAFDVELADVTSPYAMVQALMARIPASLADVLQRCAQPTAWHINLPLLTCQAVGGDPREAVVVAAAFELARLAARVLDDVEDLDKDDALWRQVGVPQATNAGSALLACAYLTLSELVPLGADPGLVVELQQDFARVALTMAAAQHLDLTAWEELLGLEPTPITGEVSDVGDGSGRLPADAGRLATALDRYWEIAAGKSGAFFALGCRAGARLAVPPAAAQPYSDFGYHLGLLLQVLNDGRGLPSADASGHGLGRGGVRDLGRRLSLPVAYTLAVCPEVRQPLLEALDSGFSAQAVDIMTRAGAVHYLLAVAESHRAEAVAALDRVHACAEPCPEQGRRDSRSSDPVAHQALTDLLPEVLPVAEAK